KLNLKYIYYYIDGHAIVQHHQDPSFMGRVKRTKDANISVTLMNVTREDAGEIKLSCRNSDGTKFDYRYNLKVTDPEKTSWKELQSN
uniref:Immunoglobulin V-set domain-containing protein n=1 Tax=Amphiprion percula TaxID=161767 RepID=A0A3P8SSY4_AMPPE